MKEESKDSEVRADFSLLYFVTPPLHPNNGQLRLPPIIVTAGTLSISTIFFRNSKSSRVLWTVNTGKCVSACVRGRWDLGDLRGVWRLKTSRKVCNWRSGMLSSAVFSCYKLESLPNPIAERAALQPETLHSPVPCEWLVPPTCIKIQQPFNKNGQQRNEIRKNRENEKLNQKKFSRKEQNREQWRWGERRLASEDGDRAMHATQEVIIQIQVLDETPKDSEQV